MLEHLILDIKKQIKFKDKTNIGDVVVVLSEGFGIIPDQINFGFVKNISKENKIESKIDLLLLHVPLRNISFRLIHEHYTGKQFFAINGNKMWICAIDPSDKSEGEPAKILKLLQGGLCEETTDN